MSARKIPTGLLSDEVTGFPAATSLVKDFKRVLLKYGVEISPQSDLSQQCRAIVQWEDRRTGKIPFDPYCDPRSEVRAGVGALHLIRLILDAEAKSGLNAVAKHLHKLNDPHAVVAQGTKAAFSDATNKLFELFLGAVCLNFASRVALDDPDASKGDNPDVLFDFRGSRWGLACKVLSGTSPLTFYERVQEGIKQIDISEAATGFVVVNMRNQIDHDALWPLQVPGDKLRGDLPQFGMWPTVDAVTLALLRMAMTKLRLFLDVNGESAIAALISRCRAQPAVLLFLQSTVMVSMNNLRVPTRVSLFHRWDLGPVSPRSNECLVAMNEALHHRA